MEPDDVLKQENLNAGSPAASPRLRDYIWRPRFVKVWWAVSFMHWAAMLLGLMIQSLGEYYNTVLAGWLGVLLYPPFMLAACGARLLWARIECGEWEMTEAPYDVRFPRLSEGGLRDPYTDPLDPRSGAMHWRHTGVYKH